MTQDEKIKFVLKKFPNIDSTELFLWHYAETFYGITIYMLKQQFIDFWKEGRELEGQILPAMKELDYENENINKWDKLVEKEDSEIPHFETPKEEPQFKDTLSEKDKGDYEHIFGPEDYDEH